MPSLKYDLKYDLKTAPALTQAQPLYRGNLEKIADPRCQTVPMAPSDGWYLFGPLVAIALVGLLGVVFWKLGLSWIEQADDPYGRLSIFADPDDFGLLCAAAVSDIPDEANDIRLLLADAGIRSTLGLRHDGRYAVLVFAEELEAARRLML